MPNFCLTLQPLAECGLGTCVNGTCVCSPDASIGKLENFFLEVPPGIVPFCAYHKDSIFGLICTLLILSIITFVAQIWAIQTMRQARRLIAELLGYPMLLASLVIHLFNQEGSLWGYHVAYTACLTISIALVSIQFLVFLTKYIRYLGRMVIGGGRQRKLALLFVKLNYTVAAALTLASVSFNVVPHVSSLNVKTLLTQLPLGIYLVCFIYLIMMTCYVLSSFIHDLQVIVETARMETLRIEGESSLTKKCERQIPLAKSVRLWTAMVALLVIVASGFCLLLPGLLIHLSTICYSIYIAFAVANLTIIRASVRKKVGIRGSKEAIKKLAAIRKPTGTFATDLTGGSHSRNCSDRQASHSQLL